MDIRSVFILFFILLIVCPCVEQRTGGKANRNTNKRPRRVKKRNRLEKLCKEQKKTKSSGTALELHAYFDLRPGQKPFACLKITTCDGHPVCFVTTHPYLKNKSINDTTTWLELVTFIQRDRKIEPIYDSSMRGWNGDKYKALSQYVHNQPAIYRMCRSATIYRFVVNENVTNTNNFYEDTSVNSTSPGNSSVKPPVAVSSNPAMTLCPLFKRKKGKSMRIKRVGRTTNTTSNNFFMCNGFDCPCMRICVGQGRRRKNFTECSTFRIICTFNCGSDTMTVPEVPIITKPTTKPTTKPKTRPTIKPKISTNKKPTKKSNKRRIRKSRKRRPTTKPRRPTIPTRKTRSQNNARTQPTRNPNRQGRRRRVNQKRKSKGNKKKKNKNKKTTTPPNT